MCHNNKCSALYFNELSVDNPTLTDIMPADNYYASDYNNAVSVISVTMQCCVYGTMSDSGSNQRPSAIAMLVNNHSRRRYRNICCIMLHGITQLYLSAGRDYFPAICSRIYSLLIPNG